jgi:hypothetical protein
MKPNSTFALLITGFFLGCSIGNITANHFPYDDLRNVKELIIQFDKTIEINFTASGTLRVNKKGDHLILYDGHVEAFRLACIEYSTGKEIWKASYKVRGYWFFEDKILVEGFSSLEMLDLKTGKSIWKKDPCGIPFDYVQGAELNKEMFVLMGSKRAMLDLENGNTILQSKNQVGGFLYKEDMQQAIKSKGIVLENKYSLSDQFYKVAVIEDRETAQDTYIWQLDTKTRTFTLSIFGHNDVLFKKHTWTIPQNVYTDNYDVAFSGLPEPEKLHGEVHCINGLLILYESYENYRWSWGKGCNRITAIDLNTHEIKYQVWGQSPSDKNYQGFHFFNNKILISNGTMHFQDEPSTFYQFNDKTGKQLDSLPKRFTLFEDLSSGILIGFHYQRTQVKNTDYTHAVSITAWDHLKNEYSKTFNFDFKEQYPYEPYVNEDGTIIFHYYDKKLGKNVLYCCKIIQHK